MSLVNINDSFKHKQAHQDSHDGDGHYPELVKQSFNFHILRMTPLIHSFSQILDLLLMVIILNSLTDSVILLISFDFNLLKVIHHENHEFLLSLHHLHMENILFMSVTLCQH